MCDLNGNKKCIGCFRCGKTRLDIDIYKPQFDMNTYLGRVRHYLKLYGPHHFFTSESKLQDARNLLKRYSNGDPVDDVSVTQLWKAKYLYESIYDVHSDQKAFIIGRPASFVPLTAVIGSAMLTYFKQISHLVFWQLMYQTFQQSVNFVERPPTSRVEDLCLLKGYAAGVLSATLTVLMYRRKLYKHTAPIVQRMGPATGAIIGTVVSIPVTRQMEIRMGIPVYDELDRKLGYSTRATIMSVAVDIIRQVFVTAPQFDSTVVLTFLAKFSAKRGWTPNRRHYFPTQLLYIAFFCSIITPFLRALVPEKGSLPFTCLRPDLQAEIVKNTGLRPKRVFFKLDMAPT